MNLTAIIIDDEKKLAENLEILLGKSESNITCIGTAHNAIDGIKLANSLKPQIIFLDINMPHYSGFELLEAMDTKDYFVVFTTAHEEFAIQAIKHKAFDYLLKPIDLDELKLCIQKIKDEITLRQKEKSAIITKPLQIQVAVKEGILLLKQQEIIHIGASGSYSVIYCSDSKKYTVTKNLKAMEDALEPALFFRCHNSHIINLHRVKKILRSEGFSLEMEDGSIVEVSRTKKDELLERL